MKHWSLRRTLLLTTNLMVMVILALGAWFNYRMTQHELNEVFDAELAQTTRLLKSLIQDPGFLAHDGSLRLIELPPLPTSYAVEGEERQADGHPYERKLAFQVWNADGELVVASQNAKTLALSLPEPGYHQIERDNYIWLSFSYFDAETSSWIYTAQREDVRSELSAYITADQLWVVFLTWLPLSVGILLIVIWLIRPVRQFAAQLTQRQPDDLRPLHAELPNELIPIQTNINLLFNRIQAYLEREKHFIADASHELRTPLAALKLHASQISAQDPQSILAVQTATERLIHLVNQLLLLTKLDGTLSEQEPMQEVSLTDLVHHALAGLPEEATAAVEWQLEVPATLRVVGLPMLLEVLLRNLLHNACKYGGDNNTVTVHAEQNIEGVLLRIRDQGEGLPIADLTRLGERFYRHPGTRHLEGAGLGLSIVQRIADLHGIKLDYTNHTHGGLLVSVQFPGSASTKGKEQL